MRTLGSVGFGSALIGALFLMGQAAPAPAAGPGTDIPIIVLVSDKDPHSVRRTDGIVQEALAELRDQMARYGYDVKTEEMLAGKLDWDLSGRRDSSKLLEMAYIAKDSGKPEFDVRAVVIFSVLGSAKDRGFATRVRVTVSGSIYDADAQRHLSRFGPQSETFAAPAHCGGICLQEVGRPLAIKVAAIVGDEARKELAELTKGRFHTDVRAANVSSTPGADTGLTTTYAIHLEGFNTLEVLEIMEVMEKEFPGFVRSHDLRGTAHRGTYGYVSKAAGHKMYKWVNIMLMDMGMDPDEDVQVVKKGTEITLKKLGPDEPPGLEPKVAPRFQ